MAETTEVSVEVAPVTGFTNDSYVKLPDSAYGELLIYHHNKPTYYLYIFDDAYKTALEQFNQTSLTLAELAEKSFAVNNLPYSLKQKIIGIKNKAHPAQISLAKYPAEYLLNALAAA
ncbi:hypothetical protein [Hymenobacter sp.]|jgi:hypothetical protein|uniref:hypothetical protein n=1 Tax=Hymenobacter sp. TaxID=1898978 RepID=UPI002EDA1195